MRSLLMLAVLVLAAYAIPRCLGMAAESMPAHPNQPAGGVPKVGNLVRNGDFALDSNHDGMADDWAFSGDQTVKVTWALDRGVGGSRAQRLTCTSFTGHGPSSHVMLAQNDTFALEGDHWYRLSLHVRGEIPSGVAWVAIRQTGPWLDLGLYRVFRVTPEWKQQQFAFRATKSVSQNIRLQIWFTDTGTMWVSDVRLAELEGQPQEMRRYTEAIPDIGSKNLVPNSSFECGGSRWGTTITDDTWGGLGPNSLLGKVDGATAARHGSSFRMDVDRATAPVQWFDYFDITHKPVLAPLLANRGWITVQPGVDYTLSAYLKSDPASLPCRIIVFQAGADWLREDVEASGEWRRLSFTFKPQSTQLFVSLGPELRDPMRQKATLWVDAVQLEKGSEATEYQLRSPIEIGLEWERPGHLFATPAAAKAVLTGFNATSKAKTVRVSASVTDFFDRVAASPKAAVTLPPGKGIRQQLKLGVARKGFYRFKLGASGGAVIPVSVERFGVIDFCRDSDGIFGMNHAYPWAGLLRLSHQFGLTWMRDWSLKWNEVEPQQGRFHFTNTDGEIDRIRKEGLNVLGLLPFPSAEWSSSGPTDLPPSDAMGGRARLAYKPRDLPEFGAYVAATAAHYRGRIRVWEILNEPLYTGYALPESAGYKTSDYVDLLKTSYQAIKQADPNAFVVGGVAADPDTNAAELIAAGALDWLDAINVHTYPVVRRPESYLPDLERLNARLKAAGKPKPIYFTEGSYYGDDDPATDPYNPGDALMTPLGSELECASYQVRFDVILLAQNVKKIIYHAGTCGLLNEDSLGGIFFEWDGAPRKMAITQSVMTALFGPDVEPIGSVWPQVRSFAFHSRGRTVIAVWDDRYQHLALSPRAGVRVLDIVGSPVTAKRVALGETPYYLVIGREVPVEKARGMLRGWLPTAPQGRGDGYDVTGGKP